MKTSKNNPPASETKGPFVNGLINTVRLEGKIGNIKKVIYVMMYWNVDIDNQTKCDDIRATDINTYLVRQFDHLAETKPDAKYDFMFNRGPLNPKYNPNSKGSYQNGVAEIFTKSLIIDPEENKVKMSENIPNVRFHYTGILDYALNKSVMAVNEIGQNVNGIWDSRNYNAGSLLRIFNNMGKIGDELYYVGEQFFNAKDLENPKLEKSAYSANIDQRFNIPDTEITKLVQKLVYKLRNSYDDENVKTTINKIIDTELKQTFIEYNTYDQDIMKKLIADIEFLKKLSEHGPVRDILLEKNNGTYGYGIDPDVIDEKLLFLQIINEKLFGYIYYIFNVLLENINLLRRLLDKKYISTAIVYDHASNSISLIRLLVKYFDFKITNWSYLKNNDLETCNKMILSSTTHSELNVVFLPILLNQCVNLNSFPKFFS